MDEYGGCNSYNLGETLDLSAVSKNVLVFQSLYFLIIRGDLQIVIFCYHCMFPFFALRFIHFNIFFVNFDFLIFIFLVLK